MADGVVVKVKRLRGPAGSGGAFSLPEYMTAHAAGADVCADLDAELTLQPGERTLVPTGMALAIPRGYEVQVRPRSGLALKYGIVLPNAPGTIDSDYRGELKVILMNAGTQPFTVGPGDRIAQLVVSPVVQAVFTLVDELPETDRGDGGFGHTGQ